MSCRLNIAIWRRYIWSFFVQKRIFRGRFEEIPLSLHSSNICFVSPEHCVISTTRTSYRMVGNYFVELTGDCLVHIIACRLWHPKLSLKCADLASVHHRSDPYIIDGQQESSFDWYETRCRSRRPTNNSSSAVYPKIRVHAHQQKTRIN